MKTFIILIQLWILTKKNSSEIGKLTPNVSAIYNDLLFSEQINSSGMVSAPLVLNTDITTSHNARNTVLEVYVHLQICHWIHRMRKL